MTVRAPLAVHSSGLGTERHLDVSDLEFSRSARGGYETASFSIPALVDSADDVLSPVSRIMIDNGRTGRRLFEGYLELPGRTVTEAGHEWKIGVVGASSVLNDRARPYLVVDTSLDRWYLFRTTSPGATGEVRPLGTDETISALHMQFLAGQPIDNSSYLSMQLDLRPLGQLVGAVGWDHVSGFNSATDFKVELVVKSTANVNTTLLSRAFTTTPTNEFPKDFVNDWSGTDMDRVAFVMNHVAGGATNVATDNRWTDVHNVFVRAKAVRKDGVTPAQGYAQNYVVPPFVVEDALHHFTTMIDIPNASIDSTYDAINEAMYQLAYPDPVRLSDVLSDLALVADDLIWEVLESNAAGKHRFNLRRYPTDVRYEATSVDGWDSPGGESDLATDIRVTWTDANGNVQAHTSQFAVPELDQWGRRRDGEVIDLGSELGGTAIAARIASRVNAALQEVPHAGTLTVARPIRDLYSGRHVQPWEIEPGYLCNVRDIDSPPMRLTDMTYRDSDMSASLTLGTPAFSLENLIAKIARRRTRRDGKPRSVNQ